MAIYRQVPQQPWRNHVLRHGTLSRTTALAEYVPPVYDGVTQRTVFRARPKAHHGRQQSVPVFSLRRMEPTVTLPRYQNASPIPQGSNGLAGLAEVIVLASGSYGEGAYGSGSYGDE